MSKPKILIQIDPDQHASTFDAVVAVDSEIDHLFTRPGVTPDDVEGLVHGAMFTRGPDDLKNTGIFFGGSNVAATEALVETAQKCFFGSMRVSIMVDPNGSNTTAAAAVLCAQRHLDLAGQKVVVLAGTGPVGQRITKIIAGLNFAGEIFVCSRKIEKAESVIADLLASGFKTNATLTPAAAGSTDQAAEVTKNAAVVFAAGAAGIELLDDRWKENGIRVLIDLNAVPPAGIAGVDVMDCGQEKDGSICYGAIGVGGLKMKIHKQAIRSLFESNDKVLDTQSIYEIGAGLE
jgi:5,10-methylene-tetrahydrofolate dehydrogenase/methenyl tetrahydrofolate cyclohydrolase